MQNTFKTFYNHEILKESSLNEAGTAFDLFFDIFYSFERLINKSMKLENVKLVSEIDKKKCEMLFYFDDIKTISKLVSSESDLLREQLKKDGLDVDVKIVIDNENSLVGYGIKIKYDNIDLSNFNNVLPSIQKQFNQNIDIDKSKSNYFNAIIRNIKNYIQ